MWDEQWAFHHLGHAVGVRESGNVASGQAFDRGTETIRLVMLVAERS